MSISHRLIETNGIKMHVAESGEGPLVVLLHGFPELWYSYRHQLEALAAAGYHAVAPDQRGYGATESPYEIDEYTILRLAGDVIGLVRALGDERFVVVGHDWGSPVASSLGLFRPDVVRGVALLSVPYVPRGDVDTLTALTQLLGPNNYQMYFQEPGIAERRLEADVRTTVKSGLIGGSGDAPSINTLSDVGEGEFLPGFEEQPLPSWLTDEDVEFYASEFERTGYRGGLNWYRNSARNWQDLAPWHGARLNVPSLFAGGDRDLVLNWPGFSDIVASLKDWSMPELTKTAILPGCGHWIQQERPSEVNELLIEFLGGLEC